ncbi:MAG: hypothetical protein J7J86_07445 [Bacteroidales bacterium]|nr:hypothetical protein [Bacteroidales bacterium]
MKNIKIQLSAILISIFLIAISCRELTVTTKINKDGSIERIIKIKGDSTDVFNDTYPVPTDTSWTTSYYKDTLTKEENKFVFTISKKFKNIDELNNLYKNDNSSYSKLDREISIHKQNKWLFTYFTYNEIYKNINSFTRYPISDFVTKEQFNLLFNSDDDTIEKNKIDSLKYKNDVDKTLSKIKLWYNKNLFEEFYDILTNNVKNINDKDLTVEKINKNKTKIFASIKDEDDLDVETLINKSSEILKTNISDKIKINEETFYELEKKTEQYIYLINGEKFKNEIIMPGTIISSNAEKTDNNTLSWDVKGNKFFYDDFIMQAESKYINTSAVVLTILLGILILLILFLSIKKKEKK